MTLPPTATLINTEQPLLVLRTANFRLLNLELAAYTLMPLPSLSVRCVKIHSSSERHEGVALRATIIVAQSHVVLRDVVAPDLLCALGVKYEGLGVFARTVVEPCHLEGDIALTVDGRAQDLSAKA